MSGKAPGEIERLVDEYGRTGKWTELGAVLDKMDRRRLANGDQETWYRARGIVESGPIITPEPGRSSRKASGSSLPPAG